MKTREAGRECAPVEPSSATSRNTSSPDMSPRPLARRSSPPDAPSTPRPGGEVADEPRTRRGSSHGERGGAFGRLQTFGRQVFEISSRVLTFRPYVAREPIKICHPCGRGDEFSFSSRTSSQLVRACGREKRRTPRTSSRRVRRRGHTVHICASVGTRSCRGENRPRKRLGFWFERVDRGS